MKSSSWPESFPRRRIKAIQELTKGQVITDKLRGMLDRPEKIESDIKSDNDVVVQILGMFDNTLSILGSSNLNETPHHPTNNMSSLSNTNDQKSKDSGESINTMTSVKTKRGRYKRRKNVSTITEVTYALIDDGYAWRKYGQKKILNSKHQRNYYRCTHKFEQGCQATKQVQKTDEEPSMYKITYIGLHTCNNLQRAPQIIMEAPDPKDNSIIISFEANPVMENNKLNTYFQSRKHTPMDGLSYFGQVSSTEHQTSWDPILGLLQYPSEPMFVMSPRLDCGGMVSPGVFSSTSSTLDYEIDDMIESHDYDDLLFEL